MKKFFRKLTCAKVEFFNQYKGNDTYETSVIYRNSVFEFSLHFVPAKSGTGAVRV